LRVWLTAVMACTWIAVRATYTADLTAFLPPSVTPNQALLIAQLRDGVAARLVLVGLEGADEATLAATSRALAERLRASDRFAYVANGAGGLSKRDRDALLDHRYLLSPAMNAEHFSAAGLRAALERTLELLASPAGTLCADARARPDRRAHDAPRRARRAHAARPARGRLVRRRAAARAVDGRDPRPRL